MNIRLTATLGLLALIVTGCGQGSHNGGNSVELATVERRDIVVAAEATGVVEPIQVVEIKSKASGEIIKMAVETGQVVKKDDLLVQVDPADLENAVEQARADLEVAQASLKVATAQKDRSDRLLASGMISDEQHEGTTLDYATAQAQLIKAKRSLDLAEERLDDATVRAPSGGTILEKNVEQGQIISSATSQVTGGTVLLKMADLSRVQVRTLVDETDIGSIKPGLPASMTVEAYRDRQFLGTVLKVEPVAVVDQNVTMFPVLIQIPNDEGLLKPGMNADVDIEISRRPGVLAVPVEAVRSVREMTILAPLVGLKAEDVTAAMGGVGQGGAGGPKQAGAPGQGRGGQGGSASQGGRGSAGPAGGRPQGSPQSSSSQGGMAGAGQRGGAPQGGPGGATPQGGPPGVGGMAPSASGGATSGGPSMGLVFVKENAHFAPRVVGTGASDWEYIEVTSGLKEGERVALLPSAQLYMQGQEMMERFRSRSSVVGTGSRGR
jgi:HlyD family secretion protein